MDTESITFFDCGAVVVPVTIYAVIHSFTAFLFRSLK